MTEEIKGTAISVRPDAQGDQKPVINPRSDSGSEDAAVLRVAPKRRVTDKLGSITAAEKVAVEVASRIPVQQDQALAAHRLYEQALRLL